MQTSLKIIHHNHNNKDLLDEDESRVKFSTNVRLEVWELSEKKDEMLKIWSA